MNLETLLSDINDEGRTKVTRPFTHSPLAIQI